LYWLTSGEWLDAFIFSERPLLAEKSAQSCLAFLDVISGGGKPPWEAGLARQPGSQRIPH
jgi:hypothetical protein